MRRLILLMLSTMGFVIATTPFTGSTTLQIIPNTTLSVSPADNKTSLSNSQTWGLAPYQLFVDKGWASSVVIRRFGARPAPQYKETILYSLSEISIIVQRMGDPEAKVKTGVSISGPVQVQFKAVSSRWERVKRRELISFVEAIREQMMADGPVEVGDADLLLVGGDLLAVGGRLAVRFTGIPDSSSQELVES